MTEQQLTHASPRVGTRALPGLRPERTTGNVHSSSALPASLANARLPPPADTEGAAPRVRVLHLTHGGLEQWICTSVGVRPRATPSCTSHGALLVLGSPCQQGAWECAEPFTGVALMALAHSIAWVFVAFGRGGKSGRLPRPSRRPSLATSAALFLFLATMVQESWAAPTLHTHERTGETPWLAIATLAAMAILMINWRFKPAGVSVREWEAKRRRSEEQRRNAEGTGDSDSAARIPAAAGTGNPSADVGLANQRASAAQVPAPTVAGPQRGIPGLEDLVLPDLEPEGALQGPPSGSLEDLVLLNPEPERALKGPPSGCLVGNKGQARRIDEGLVDAVASIHRVHPGMPNPQVQQALRDQGWTSSNRQMKMAIVAARSTAPALGPNGCTRSHTCRQPRLHRGFCDPAPKTPTVNAGETAESQAAPLLAPPSLPLPRHVWTSGEKFEVAIDGRSFGCFESAADALQAAQGARFDLGLDAPPKPASTHWEASEDEGLRAFIAEYGNRWSKWPADAARSEQAARNRWRLLSGEDDDGSCKGGQGKRKMTAEDASSLPPSPPPPPSPTPPRPSALAAPLLALIASVPDALRAMVSCALHACRAAGSGRAVSLVMLVCASRVSAVAPGSAAADAAGPGFTITLGLSAVIAALVKKHGSDTVRATLERAVAKERTDASAASPEDVDLESPETRQAACARAAENRRKLAQVTNSPQVQQRAASVIARLWRWFISDADNRGAAGELLMARAAASAEAYMEWTEEYFCEVSPPPFRFLLRAAPASAAHLRAMLDQGDRVLSARRAAEYARLVEEARASHGAGAPPMPAGGTSENADIASDAALLSPVDGADTAPLSSPRVGGEAGGMYGSEATLTPVAGTALPSLPAGDEAGGMPVANTALPSLPAGDETGGMPVADIALPLLTAGDEAGGMRGSDPSLTPHADDLMGLWSVGGDPVLPSQPTGGGEESVQGNSAERAEPTGRGGANDSGAHEMSDAEQAAACLIRQQWRRLIASRARTAVVPSARYDVITLRRLLTAIPARALDPFAGYERARPAGRHTSTANEATSAAAVGVPVELGVVAEDSTNALARRRRAAAWAAGRRLRSVPASTWLAVAFAYEMLRRTQVTRERLQAQASRQEAALARAAVQISPLRSVVEYVRRLRAAVAMRQRPQPRPMAYDVGYDAVTRHFSFRSGSGAITSSHPHGDSMEIVAALSPAGRVVPPMQPPSDCPIALVPEATGMWCYLDTATGAVSWHAPPGSMPLTTVSLTSADFSDRPPPCLHPSIQLGALDGTPWEPIYQDSNDRVLLFHRLTGAIREAPWIALRTSGGRAYFANLLTRETRWFPPRLWMEGWLFRPLSSADRRGCPEPHPLVGGTAYGRSLLPPEFARQRVEGGAPYLDARGSPQYGPDPCDSSRTHPRCNRPMPLVDRHGLPFECSDFFSVMADAQHDGRDVVRRLEANISLAEQSLQPCRWNAAARARVEYARQRAADFRSRWTCV